jgi:PhnB protein
MAHINVYLTFNGNCREAMAFYQYCLGGKLELQTIGESPLAEKMPEKMKKSVLHSSLIKDEWVIMGSDMVSELGFQRGTSVGMMLNCNSEEETRELYSKLSVGGEATHPLEITFWGALFGDLKDKFGNQWLLHYHKDDRKK